MNEILKILKKLKSGKPVLIPDLTKRHSIIGMLDEFEIKVTQDGAFIQLLEALEDH